MVFTNTSGLGTLSEVHTF